VRSEQEVYEDCVYQIGALAGIARACGTDLSHAKAHGALYNMACRDDRYGRRSSPRRHCSVYHCSACRGRGWKRSVPESARSSPRGLPIAATGPTAVWCRGRSRAFVQDPAAAVRQALVLVRERGVRTLCVHGDNPQALAFVRALREG